MINSVEEIKALVGKHVVFELSSGNGVASLVTGYANSMIYFNPTTKEAFVTPIWVKYISLASGQLLDVRRITEFKEISALQYTMLAANNGGEQ